MDDESFPQIKASLHQLVKLFGVVILQVSFKFLAPFHRLRSVDISALCFRCVST